MNMKTTTVSVVTLLCALQPVHASESGAYYVELFGGGAKNLMGQPQSASNRSGAYLNGVTDQTQLASGGIYGLRAGYAISKSWRFDLSYCDTSNDFTWKTVFSPGNYANFKGNVLTKSLIATGYYNFKPTGNVSPYVGLGLGASQKTLKSAAEYYSTTPYAYIENGDTTGLVYRLASGVDYGVTPQLKLNLNISAMHLGDVSSGPHRTINGTKSSIGKYEFKDLALADITLGLRYSF
jgi:opacity protein-like surface antigen